MLRKSLVTLFMVGTFMVVFAFTPALSSAGEFAYAGPPAFTVTYADNMSNHPENPKKLPLRLGTGGSLPILEVNVQAIPEGKSLETIKEILSETIKAATESDVDIKSSEAITLACGTPANATLFGFMYQGWMPLDSYIVSAFKDGKWITVTVIQGPDEGIVDPAKSLKFK